MALVERPPSPYERPPANRPIKGREGWTGCREAVWIKSSLLKCEARAEHEIHFAQFGPHIVRWWGPIGATKIDPPQFIW